MLPGCRCDQIYLYYLLYLNHFVITLLSDKENGLLTGTIVIWFLVKTVWAEQKNLISSGTDSQPRKSGTHLSVCEVTRETDQDNHSDRISVFFWHSIRNCDFSSRNLTINNSVNFQSFLTKFCMIVAKWFFIASCRFCLNWLRFSYVIM